MDFETFTDRVIWKTECSYGDCRILWRSGIRNTDEAISIFMNSVEDGVGLESAIISFMEGDA